MKVKYLIVGAGIAGLYTAYNLNKKYNETDILIIEKSQRVGGRIKTFHYDNTTLELGASKIADNHKNVLELVKELNLDDKLGIGGDDRQYYNLAPILNNGYLDHYETTEKINLSQSGFFEVISDLYERLKDPIFFESAKDYTLLSFLEKYIGVDKAQEFKNMFGYDGDFDKQNAIDGLIMFNKTFSKGMKYRGLEGGFEQIIIKLKEYLLLKNIKIITNCELVDIKKTSSIYECSTKLSSHKLISASRVIMAIPKNELFKIDYLNSFDILNSVVNKPLIRMYMVFPLDDNKLPWFKDIKTIITTKTMIRQFIPVDPSRGILMIYCSGMTAKNWYVLEKQQRLTTELMNYLRKIFINITIPEPISIITNFWPAGTHMWRAGVNSQIMSKRILRPNPQEHVYIVGESYSMTQQWSEGALQTVKDLMDLIPNLT